MLLEHQVDIASSLSSEAPLVNVHLHVRLRSSYWGPPTSIGHVHIVNGRQRIATVLNVPVQCLASSMNLEPVVIPFVSVLISEVSGRWSCWIATPGQPLAVPTTMSQHR